LPLEFLQRFTGAFGATTVAEADCGHFTNFSLSRQRALAALLFETEAPAEAAIFKDKKYQDKTLHTNG